MIISHCHQHNLDGAVGGAHFFHDFFFYFFFFLFLFFYFFFSISIFIIFLKSFFLNQTLLNNLNMILESSMGSKRVYLQHSGKL